MMCREVNGRQHARRMKELKSLMQESPTDMTKLRTRWQYSIIRYDINLQSWSFSVFYHSHHERETCHWQDTCIGIVCACIASSKMMIQLHYDVSNLKTT